MHVRFLLFIRFARDAVEEALLFVVVAIGIERLLLLLVMVLFRLRRCCLGRLVFFFLFLLFVALRRVFVARLALARLQR